MKDFSVFSAYVSVCKTHNPDSVRSVDNVTWLWFRNCTCLFCSSAITISFFLWLQNLWKFSALGQESQLCRDNYIVYHIIIKYLSNKTAETPRSKLLSFLGQLPWMPFPLHRVCCHADWLSCELRVLPPGEVTQPRDRCGTLGRQDSAAKGTGNYYSPYLSLSLAVVEEHSRFAWNTNVDYF